MKGFQFTPKTPTPQMLMVADTEFRMHPAQARRLWEAMSKAAPTPDLRMVVEALRQLTKSKEGV